MSWVYSAPLGGDGAAGCLLEVRLAGGLLAVARTLRVLKRFGIDRPRVRLEGRGAQEVATLNGALVDPACSQALAYALSRLPHVQEASIVRDGEQVVAHFSA